MNVATFPNYIKAGGGGGVPGTMDVASFPNSALLDPPFKGSKESGIIFGKSFTECIPVLLY